MLVIHNTFKPGSLLRWKSNSVYCHTVHESVAMGKFLVGYIPNSENVRLNDKSHLWASMKVANHWDCCQTSLIPLVIVLILRGTSIVFT